MDIRIKTRLCDRIALALRDLEEDRDPMFDGRRDCVWVEAKFGDEVYNAARAWIEPNGSAAVDWKTYDGRELSDGERTILRGAAEVAKAEHAAYLELQNRFYQEIVPRLEGESRLNQIAIIKSMSLS